MTIVIILMLFLGLLCLICEAFFSGSEIAIVSMDKIRLRSLVSGGDKRAKLIAELLRRPEGLLGTTLLATNFSTVLASCLVTYIIILTLGQQYEYLAIVIVSPLVLIFAEIIPKTVAQARAEQWALTAVQPLMVARRLLSPLVSVLGQVSKLFLSYVRSSNIQRSPLMTREDLEFALRSTGQRGGIKAIERRMISRILEFKDITVGEAMIPLVEVIALEVHGSVRNAIEVALKFGLSRVPLYRERIDNVIGVLLVTDLLWNNEIKSLEELLRPITFVPGSKPVKDMLRQFKQNNDNLAVVVDEYGGTVGIVTVEDIFEEVVGEIEDEFDIRKKLVRRLDVSNWIIDARIELLQLKEHLKLQLPVGEYETLGGFLLEQFKRIPRVGEQFTYKGYLFKVTKASHRTVDEVQMTLLADAKN